MTPSTPCAKVGYKSLANVLFVAIEVNDGGEWRNYGMFPAVTAKEFPEAGRHYLSMDALQMISDLVALGYRIQIG